MGILTHDEIVSITKFGFYLCDAMGVTSKKKFKRKKTKLSFDLVCLMSPLTVMKGAKFI